MSKESIVESVAVSCALLGFCDSAPVVGAPEATSVRPVRPPVANVCAAEVGSADVQFPVDSAPVAANVEPCGFTTAVSPAVSSTTAVPVAAVGASEAATVDTLADAEMLSCDVAG